jgi:hypothetical protein
MLPARAPLLCLELEVSSVAYWPYCRPRLSIHLQIALIPHPVIDLLLSGRTARLIINELLRMGKSVRAVTRETFAFPTSEIDEVRGPCTPPCATYHYHKYMLAGLCVCFPDLCIVLK